MLYERGRNISEEFIAAFYAALSSIQHLTMFDYWVLLLLRHLRIPNYVLVLVAVLCKGTGSRGELDMSIVAVGRKSASVTGKSVVDLVAGPCPSSMPSRQSFH